jgi:hypothetical protein
MGGSVWEMIGGSLRGIRSGMKEKDWGKNVGNDGLVDIGGGSALAICDAVPSWVRWRASGMRIFMGRQDLGNFFAIFRKIVFDGVIAG